MVLFSALGCMVCCSIPWDLRWNGERLYKIGLQLCICRSHSRQTVSTLAKVLNAGFKEIAIIIRRVDSHGIGVYDREAWQNSTRSLAKIKTHVAAFVGVNGREVRTSRLQRLCRPGFRAFRWALQLSLTLV